MTPTMGPSGSDDDLSDRTVIRFRAVVNVTVEYELPRDAFPDDWTETQIHTDQIEAWEDDTVGQIAAAEDAEWKIKVSRR